MAKALSWRVTALVVTVIVVKIATGDTEMAATVGAADALVKFVLYFFHERLWIRVKLGRGQRAEDAA